jgi:L-iditol 2-dehydrogenase/galactitol-1-phosphate 5-dehydrogenase
MKALVLEKNAVLKFVKDHPRPTGQLESLALVRVAACGICGSDLARGFGGKAYRYPLVMGHEFSGVVERPCANGRFAKGARVAVFPLLPCRKCGPCQTGDFAQCVGYDYYGSRRDGGFAEYVEVPEDNLFPIPDEVSILHAAMTEPAAVALHGVRRLDCRAGDRAAVLGAGPIGNLSAQWLRIHGCREVFVVDLDADKLAVAATMGFRTINAGKEDPVEAILAATDGLGVELAVEAVGLPQTFLQATRVAARFGRVLYMGNIAGCFSIEEKDFSNILRKELTICGTWNSKITPKGTDDWSTVLKYLDRELQVAPLITDRISLEEGPAMFAALIERRGGHNKVIFDLSREMTS